jgi:nucleoid-associated protein YgaU
MAEQDLKKNPQKEEVDEQGIEKILKTGEFRIYTTTKEDTLWRIAEKCYGSGYYFPVLMECNPSLHIYDMEGGTRVRILKDDRLVQRLYHKITRMAGDELVSYYRVLEGDTFESIARKFYNREGPAKRIKDLNPHGELLPGSRIKIALE